MLRWMLRKTRKAKIRNNVIRERAGLNTVSKKVNNIDGNGLITSDVEMRTMWEKRTELIEVEGKRGGKKLRRRWKDCVAKDLREQGLNEVDIMDRNKWRRRISNSHP
ncbi:uncharacterized protein [Diabrotica undecimpunctata]|uniref:uncharacterized protein n=1 Tax=Diabrotica undecimpunctata TaxID=50387 RepID=UPI003B63DE5A